MLVLAMQFSRTMAAGVTGLEAQQGPRHEGEGFEGAPLQNGTEDGTANRRRPSRGNTFDR